MAKNLNRVPQFGLAIDWETSGYSLPNYAEKHQGISFGAIIFDVRTLDPIEELYREIKFNPKYLWDEQAERIHGVSREHLAKHGISQEDAAVELGNLVVKYLGTEDVMLLGHRVHFDRAFTTQLMKSIGIDFSYHPTSIDSCSIATVLMELTYSEDIFQTLGLPPRGKHNALEDIQNTLKSIQKMKHFFISGVEASLV
jgi:oligoribonuclease (3'-5' exoribonuclease)